MPRVKDTIRRAMDAGIRVAIATGRPYASTKHLIEELGLNSPSVLLQGQAIYDVDGTLLWTQTMPDDLAHDIVTFAENNDYTAIAYGPEHILTNKDNEFIQYMARFRETTPMIVESLHEWIGKVPLAKINFLDAPMNVAKIRRQMKEEMGDRVTIVQAIAMMMECLPPNASKGAGVEQLLKMLNIPASELLAAGDGENDVEMLKLAGIGVAMENGMQIAKEAADHIVAAHDDDGLAEAIERFALAENVTH
jgi:Cof subfamily protein (haloacid dehalogenase superfamily)